MENSQQALFQTIRAFSGQRNMVVIPRELIRFLGDINQALLLSQLIYWSDKASSGWIFKTYKEWEEELSLSKFQIKTASEKLKECGYLDTKIKKARGAPTVHYKLEWEVFSQSFVQFLNDGKSTNFTFQSEISSHSLTELTTEPTTEITKDHIPYSDIVEHLNEKCGTSYRATTDATRREINGRWREGYRLDDFKTVIDHQASEWLGTNMQKYLRPQTLFNKTKFESYINAARSDKRNGKGSGNRTGHHGHSQASASRKKLDGAIGQF